MRRIKIAAAMLSLMVCGTAVFSVGAIGPINDEPKCFTATKAVIKDMNPDNDKLVVTLNKDNVKRTVGKKFRVKAQLNRVGEVKYYSTNKNVAVVGKNGVVKTKTPGVAKIVAECNGTKDICNVNVVKPKGNNIKDSTMTSIVSEVGKQTDYAYSSSTIMCSAYSFAYAYYQVTGNYLSPGSVWTYGGCVWTGGTYRRLSSASEMLSTIKNEIDQNKACVGLLSQNGNTHYVTFYSYSGDGTTLSDFTVMDPWDGRIKNASSFGYYNYHVVTID